MASAKTIVNACNDATDVLDAIKRRAVLAEAAARGANRQANRLGTRVSGGRGEDEVSYPDPVKDAALNALATLEQVQTEVGAVKEYLYRTAAVLAEWAPNRTFEGRRCGEDDCARAHHAQGLCQTHYRAWQRAERRRAAIAARQRTA